MSILYEKLEQKYMKYISFGYHVHALGEDDFFNVRETYSASQLKKIISIMV